MSELCLLLSAVTDENVDSLLEKERKDGCSSLSKLVSEESAASVELVLKSLKRKVEEKILTKNSYDKLLHVENANDVTIEKSIHPIMSVYKKYGLRLCKAFIYHYYYNDVSLLEAKDSSGKSIFDYEKEARFSK